MRASVLLTAAATSSSPSSTRGTEPDNDGRVGRPQDVPLAGIGHWAFAGMTLKGVRTVGAGVAYETLSISLSCAPQAFPGGNACM